MTVDDRRYRAFTYGRRAEMLTKDRISLAGIAIDDALAFTPDPVRRLESAEGLIVEAFGEQMHFTDEDELDRYIALLVENESASGPADILPVTG